MISKRIPVKGLLLFCLVVFSHLSYSQIIDYVVYDYDSLPLQGKRVALVIGNSSYFDKELNNASYNAYRLSASLTKHGFEVLAAIDVDRKQMLSKIIEYEEKLKQQIEISFIYYIGYGFNYIDNSSNYLLPIAASLKKAQDLELEAINTNRIFQIAEKNKTGINIFIFDASYDKDYSLQNLSPFLMPDTRIPPGSYMLISNTSSTKNFSNSTNFFTDEFINVLKIPNLPMEDFFKQLRINIYKKSNKMQIPWNTQTVDGLFYLNRK
ncbi:MAG: caspase family protein [Bacteroidota bacterium]